MRGDIESDAFAQAKLNGPYDIAVAIKRKMDDHNRKRKDVIYFYYRRTALDRFAECVGL